MELLHNGITLKIPSGAFPLSTDSMLLSGFARLKKQAQVLDLGSGCATLGLLLCASDPGCHVTGIELDEAAHAAALANIERNQLSERLFSICADLRGIQDLVPSGTFSCCISNPPYFSGGPVSKTLPGARQDGSCTTKDLFRAAAWALRYGGDFYLVNRPEKLAELCAAGAENALEAKRLCLVRHQPGSPVSIILLQFRKGAKPGLSWEELTLHTSQGEPTEAYRKLYHL